MIDEEYANGMGRGQIRDSNCGDLNPIVNYKLK
jgi:hypothetical protein